MSVTNVVHDPEAMTLTFTSEYAAPVSRVWDMWRDPRLLERWWGPPTYPATFVEHDLTPGGRVRYYMTGPGGDRHDGWWRVVDVDAPSRLEFENGLAGDDGEPRPGTPAMIVRVELSERASGGTRMDVVATFASLEAMELFLGMGFREGFAAAIGQVDDLLT
ncbi:MAG: SRPBCC domain-containing protein [Acidimicrobiales bacterium]